MLLRPKPRRQKRGCKVDRAAHAPAVSARRRTLHDVRRGGELKTYARAGRYAPNAIFTETTPISAAAYRHRRSRSGSSASDGNSLGPKTFTQSTATKAIAIANTETRARFGFDIKILGMRLRKENCHYKSSSEIDMCTGEEFLLTFPAFIVLQAPKQPFGFLHDGRHSRAGAVQRSSGGRRMVAPGRLPGIICRLG